tara:strand:- start:496 stop:1614 length:1119 start_codon:yes stop_codon:yes gene_type:complete
MSQVSDYNIANASGASVRSDLNAVFDAIKTLNSGGTDPTNPEAFMPYVDTGDNNNLKLRNASNNGFTTVGSVNETNLGLLPRSGGTMTGQILGDDGSVAGSPAFSFNGDADTGMFQSGANNIGFSTAGVERVVIDSTSLSVRNQGRITFRELASNGSSFVGLKSPAALSGNVELTLPPTIVDGGFLQTDNSGNLSFQIVAGVPTGAVFCVAVATIPSGYLECNGTAVSRSTFAALFALIGTQYGTGNGSTTFNLPDLRGEFVRGFDNGRGVDSGRSIASNQTAQNQSHSHGANANATSNVNDPGHKHNARGYGNQDDGGNQFTGSNNSATRDNAINNANTGISVSTNVSVSVASEGGESRPRNVAMMYIIKV